MKNVRNVKQKPLRMVSMIMLELDSPIPRIPTTEWVSEKEEMWVCEIRIPNRSVTWMVEHMPDRVIKPVPVRLLSNGGVSGPDQQIHINPGEDCKFTLTWRQSSGEEGKQRPTWANYARRICMIKTGVESDGSGPVVVRCKISNPWKLAIA